MALDVVIYEVPGHPRSKAVCRAMLEGIEKCGDRVGLKSSLQYIRPEAEVAVFYGLAGKLHKALRDYPAKGHTAIYVDLGYWGRKAGGGRFAGYHKISVNSRHPTAYFQARPHPDDRIKAMGIEALPWRRSDLTSPIILAAMGPKGSSAEGFGPLGWEKKALAILRRHTRRPIIYRPKPNVVRPEPLPGAQMAPYGQELEAALRGAHALVARHSNAALEAITLGVPAFVEEGVALPMACADLSKIEKPVRPKGREQWLADVAYVQWSIAEMAAGLPWRHLKDEGLI